MFPLVSPARARASRLRATAILVGTAAMLALGASMALAHDPLATTGAYVPANGSVIVGQLPATIVVNFQDTFPKAGDAANPNTPVARVVDASGADHVAQAVRDPGNAKQLVMTTKDRGTTGKYTVTWTITASDGHAVSNDGSDASEEGSPLVFTVRGDGATTSNTTTAAATSSSSSSTVIATIVGFAIVILIGAGAILFWIRRRRDEFSEESDS